MTATAAAGRRYMLRSRRAVCWADMRWKGLACVSVRLRVFASACRASLRLCVSASVRLCVCASLRLCVCVSLRLRVCLGKGIRLRLCLSGKGIRRRVVASACLCVCLSLRLRVFALRVFASACLSGRAEGRIACDYRITSPNSWPSRAVLGRRGPVSECLHAFIQTSNRVHLTCRNAGDKEVQRGECLVPPPATCYCYCSGARAISIAAVRMCSYAHTIFIP